MFGRTAKPAAIDSTRKVAMFIVNTLLGTVDTGLASGVAFTKAYAAHQAKPESDARALLLAEVATLLVDQDPATAGRLVDALAEKVGR